MSPSWWNNSAKLASNDTQEDNGSIPTTKQKVPVPVVHSKKEKEANLGPLCVHNDNIDGGGTAATEYDYTVVSIP
eukprot:6465840-Ditylum_brightwellii.AAC.1